MPIMVSTCEATGWRRRAGALVLAAASAPAALATEPGPLQPCWLTGVEVQALCGQVRRPLDAARPQGTQIDVHFAVLPALAQRKADDPVFFFAGGPGQSAIDLAGVLSGRFARLGQRRDLVFVDQRGTGRSAPLKCADDEEPARARPLAEAVDPQRRLERLQGCREALQRLPYGDLRQFGTAAAIADVDAVREALGAARVNAIGMSYGSRAVLEYLRQFPQRVRRAVLDGAVPPDMALPAASSIDSQQALEALFADCAADPGCARRHPDLRRQWQQLLASLPTTTTLVHPLTGQDERVVVTRDVLLGLVRPPLYVPALASALPAAIAEAAQGRFAGLSGLAAALGTSGSGLATGMHFSVVCSEDLNHTGTLITRASADFGENFEQFYQQACAAWPRAQVPAAFFQIPPASAPTLVLSGGIDPATPTRHGLRVAQALGAKARHVVVAKAGHGVSAISCVRDIVVRFVTAADDDAALALPLDCAARIPRPPDFVPVGSAPASQVSRR
jgi:pimeloyl-ACP methyl ester carboxylesterase